MNLEQYQEESARTCPSLGNISANIIHMEIGIITEIGELADIFKKNFAYGKPIDTVHLGEEIADICWYVANKDRFNNIIYSAEPVQLLESKIETFDTIDFMRVFARIQWLTDTNTIIYNWLKTIAEFYNLNFYKCLENNIAKLKIRYPDKFDTTKALNRDLKSERKELEK